MELDEVGKAGKESGSLIVVLRAIPQIGVACGGEEEAVLGARCIGPVTYQEGQGCGSAG